MASTETLQSLTEEEVERLRTGAAAPDTATGGDASDGSADEESADAEDPISKDDLFHLLQNSRRRAVIRYLRGREGSVRMRDVAEQVAAWEHDTTVAQLTSAERQRVYIALYQSHLETLADAGVIEYNKPRGIIEPRPLLDHVASYLDADRRASTDADEGDRDRDEWDRGYLAVSVVGSLFLLGSVVGVPVLGAIPGLAASVLVLLAFVALTLAKFALDRTGRDGSD